MSTLERPKCDLHQIACTFDVVNRAWFCEKCAENTFKLSSLQPTIPINTPNLRKCIECNQTFTTTIDAKTCDTCFEFFLGQELDKIKEGLSLAQSIFHRENRIAGWWTDPDTGKDYPKEMFRWIVPTKLALIHSKVSKTLEGYRKDKMDDHLPDRKMIEVELADVLIRVFDLAGALNLDLAGAVLAKREYNLLRQDHKKEARSQTDGKKF